MKTLLLCLSLSFFWTNATFALESPFEPTVPNLSIKNAHYLSTNPLIIRGMRPRKPGELDQLKNLGIEEILNFRTHSSGPESTLAEEKLLTEYGWPMNKFYNISMPWKDVEDFTYVCKQIVQGLIVLKEAKALYLHCTVGEDRTGVLAGLYSMAFKGWSQDKAFFEEMCPHGFARGNPNKPSFVVEKIRKAVTPLFAGMSEAIEKKVLTKNNLNVNLCNDIDWQRAVEESKQFRCEPAETP